MSTYPPNEMMKRMISHAPRILQFDREAYFPEWQGAVRRSFRQLLGTMPLPVPPALRVEAEERRETPVPHRELRLVFDVEQDCQACATLLLPTAATAAAPVPAVICLQGHASGAHLSLGLVKYAGDETSLQGDRAFGLQAVSRGYAALALEQRGFGERADNRGHRTMGGCHLLAMSAQLVGRTVLGMRVWDVARSIDVLTGNFPEVDASRIGVMGHSGGGTVAYYAAAHDPRVAAVMPSCSVCTFRHSIASIDHCVCNYLPNVMHYFDMADLAGLIVPRPLVLVAGRIDEIFLLEGVEEAFAEIREIYEHENAAGRTALVVGDGGHRFYADLSWAAFDRITGWRER